MRYSINNIISIALAAAVANAIPMNYHPIGLNPATHQADLAADAAVPDESRHPGSHGHRSAYHNPNGRSGNHHLPSSGSDNVPAGEDEIPEIMEFAADFSEGDALLRLIRSQNLNPTGALSEQEIHVILSGMPKDKLESSILKIFKHADIVSQANAWNERESIAKSKTLELATAILSVNRLHERDFIQEMYYDMHIIGSGGYNVVYRALRKSDNRPVALRVPMKRNNPLYADGNYKIAYADPAAFTMAAMLSLMKDLSKKTEFWPDVYKIFVAHAEALPRFSTFQIFQWGYVYASITEMELLDGDLDGLLNEYGTFSDSIIFETCFGLWTANYYHQVIFDDPKARNIGYKMVDYYRVYRIGKMSYVFEPGPSPRQLDMDDPNLSHRSGSRQCGFFNRRSEALAKELRSDRESHQFEIFAKYFARVGTAEIPEGAKVKHFTITDDELAKILAE